MKYTLFSFFLLLFSFSKAQDIQKYDSRLLKNHGDTIMTIYSKNHNYYNFLLFELDYSYEILPETEVKANKIIPISEFKNDKGVILTKGDIIKGKFNFKEWRIVLKQNEPLVIGLDQENVIYFFDKVSNNIRFGKSPLYTK